jgi:uncharacterized membrane protein
VRVARFEFTRVLFAVAAASLAVLNLVYGDMALIGQSVPGWMPGRESWIYASAVLVLVASVGLCFSRTAPASAVTIGSFLAIWALTCAPSIVAMPLSIGAWYPFCEALTTLVGVWLLCSRAQRLARSLFGLTCVFYGGSHFVYADYTASMVPAWLPGHLGLAYFTGIGHIAAGIGVIFEMLPRLAATLEAVMMSLFGLLVWVPSFFMLPRPAWATPPQNQWTELIVNLALAAAAWVVARSLAARPWIAGSHRHAISGESHG